MPLEIRINHRLQLWFNFRALAISVVSCSVTVRQTTIASIGIEARPVLAQSFEERTVTTPAQGFVIVRCRSYLFIDNRGGRSTSIVNVHESLRIEGLREEAPAVLSLDIGQPAGLFYWASASVTSVGVVVTHVHRHQGSSASVELEQRLADFAAASSFDQEDEARHDADARSDAAAMMALRLVQFSVLPELLASSLPLGLETGSVNPPRWRFR